MFARHGDGESEPLALDQGGDGAAGRAERDVEQAGVGSVLRAKAPDCFQPLRPRGGGQTVELVVVAVQHGDSVGAHAVEDFRLGVGDGLDRIEKLQVDRFDVGDERHMGADLPGQRPQLARVVHAQFEHAEPAVGGQAGQRQRHAPMIVQTAFGGVGRPLRRQHMAQRFLRAGLADRAGDADHARAAVGLRRLPQRRHGVQRVALHQQERRVGAHPVGNARDQGRDRARRQRGGDEGVPVEIRPLNGDEQVAVGDFAAVDGQAGGAPGAVDPPPGGGGGAGGGPQDGFDAHDPISATALRASSASSKGRTSVPTVWPCSWPFPAMTNTSPG